MFQNNPLLAQLKQQIEASKEYVAGVVKASDKAFGFLECDKKSYFIPPAEMKKVMHGDSVKAVVKRDGDKEQVEIDSLLEPMLDRFIAQVRLNKEGKLQLAVDHPSIKQTIPANTHKKATEKLENGDWVVAQLKRTHCVTTVFSLLKLPNLSVKNLIILPLGGHTCPPRTAS